MVRRFIGETSLIDEANRQPPHKIDENMWKNREQMEEILFLLSPSRWPVQVNLSIVLCPCCLYFACFW